MSRKAKPMAIAKLFRRALGVCFGLALMAGPVAAQQPGGGSAVIFSYQRFGEADVPLTSVSIAQLEAHIAELTSGKYRVMPLETIIDDLAAGRPLPDRAIAITIDDGVRSAWREAWPRLRAAKLPFTLFVTTDMIGEKGGRNLGWDQIREMLAGGGVSIGHHSAAHAHMPFTDEAANRQDIARALVRFEKELGMRPALFAYPYGEFGRRERDMIADMGFKAAFGHHSGVVHAGEDRFALPRFTMNMKYAEMDRFRLAANAIALPVTDISPAEWLLTRENNPPAFGFTVDPAVKWLDQLRCYASNQDAPLKMERLGETRIEVRMTKSFSRGTGRINCTMPAGGGRWRWLGQGYVIP